MKHQLEYMLTRLRLFIGDSESEDLVEYNLLAGLVGVAVALSPPELLASIKTTYSRLASKVTEAASI